MNARCDVAQPSRLRVPVASRDADCPATSVRRDAAPTRRRGRLRYDQRRIAAELKRLQAETTAELDALLPSVLDKAFKGEW
jgi:hypothetical protein